MAIVFFVLGLVFHYFLPFTEYMLPSGMRESTTLPSLVMISACFWKVYMYWDICLLAFIALFIVSLAWTFRHCGYISIRTAMSRRIYYAVVMILLPLGCITNMFYFLRDVYPNISQAVAGGAPVSGIITIEAPGELLRHDDHGKLVDSVEVTKFCSILYRDENFWFIDEQLIGGSKFGIEDSSFTIRPRTTRVRLCDVKQFTPLRIPMFTRDGRRTLFFQDMLHEFVHNIDMFLELRFTTSTPVETVNAMSVFNTTNDISATCITDNLPLWILHSSDQYVLKEGPTNFCYHISYRHLPLPTILTVSEFRDILADNNVCARYIYNNLPEIPKRVFPSCFKLEFLVNLHVPMTVYSTAMHRYDKVIIFSKGDITGGAKNGKLSDGNPLKNDSGENNICGTNNMTNKVMAPKYPSSNNAPTFLK